ncbi:MAG: immunoglobulin domain-containing protein [Candidatus Didemnitutus sp.]|nr:immunoglobulin domain-containing protein [Candidatus Didemnitutus sp.]
MNVYPEHTMEAYRAAVADGAYCVEVDCFLLGDQTLAIMHDDTLNRTTTQAGPTSAVPNLAAWRQVRIDGSKLIPVFPGRLFSAPTLDDVLAEFANKTPVVVEAKGPGTGTPIVQALQRFGVRRDMALVNSFNESELEAARAAGYRTCLNFDVVASVGRFESFPYNFAALNAATDEALLQQITARGIKVIIYTVDRQQERDRLLRLGISGFYSNNSLYLEGIDRTPAARSTDPFANQTWYHGQLPANSDRRGVYSAPNRWGYDDHASDRYSGCLQGWCSPLNAGDGAAPFELALSVTMGAAVSDDRWAGIWLTTSDQAIGDELLPVNAIYGLHFQLTKQGRLQAMSYNGGIPSLVGSVDTGKPIATGATVRVRLSRQASKIVFWREDASVSLELNETINRGTYVTFGARGVDVWFSDVTVNAGAAPEVRLLSSTQFVPTNGTATLSCRATGQGPMTFQWRRNGVPIPGATAEFYVIRSASANDAGSYSVEVTSPRGTTASGTIQVMVGPGVFAETSALALDGAGRTLVVDATNHTVFQIGADNVATMLAGSSQQAGSSDGSAANARFNQPRGVGLLTDGTILVADSGNALVRAIATDRIVRTFAGSVADRGWADGTGVAATFSTPAALAVDATGNLWLADAGNHTVRRIAPDGAVTTWAGAGGVRGDNDGPRGSARFNAPAGIAVSNNGEIFVADTGNHTIRRISVNGTVSTLAGLAGVSGALDGRGATALFNRPSGLSVGSAGEIYVADAGNSTIRKVLADGTTVTLAGVPTVSGLRDGSGLSALFSSPGGVARLASGELLVADAGNGVLRRISTGGDVVTVPVTLVGVSAAAPVAPVAPANSVPAATGGGSGGGGGGGGASGTFGLAVALLLGLRRLFGRSL